MIRATTPKHSFTFDVNPEETFSEILITYAQNGKIVLEKHKSDLTFEACDCFGGKPVYTAFVKLTQEEKNYSLRIRRALSIYKYGRLHQTEKLWQAKLSASLFRMC